MIKIPEGKELMSFYIKCSEIGNIVKSIKKGYLRITTNEEDVYIFAQDGRIIGAYKIRGEEEFFGKSALPSDCRNAYAGIYELKDSVLGMIKEYYPQIFENIDNIEIKEEIKDVKEIKSKDKLFEKFKINKSSIEKEADKIIADFLFNVRGLDDLIEEAKSKIKKEVEKSYKLKNFKVDIKATRMDGKIAFSINVDVVYPSGIFGKRKSKLENEMKKKIINVCKDVIRNLFKDFKIKLEYKCKITFKAKGLI